MKLSKIIPFILILVLLTGCQEETPKPTAPPQPTPAPAQPTEVQPEIEEGSVLLTGDGEEVTLTTFIEIGSTIRWAVGSRSNVPNLVLYSGDSGQSWEDRTPPDGRSDSESYAEAIISFWDESTGWVIYSGSNVLWKTNDAGLSWESYTLEISASKFSRIDILNENTAWVMIITVQEPRAGNITLYRTLDGGIYWDEMLNPSDGGPHSFTKNGLSFGTTEYGWIGRVQGFFITPYLDITRDGGRSWEMVNFPSPPAFPEYFDDCYCDVFDPQVNGYGIGTFHLSCRCHDDTDYPYTEFEYKTSDDGGSWSITALTE